MVSDQPGGGCSLQECMHALKCDPGLRIVGQEHTEERCEIGHEAQVVDKEREIANAESPRVQRLCRQNQDEARSQAHNIAKGRVQELF